MRKTHRSSTLATGPSTGIAGTIMALVAVAATAAAVPAPVTSGRDCRAAVLDVMDSQPMRAVVAVVAAACDLLGIERSPDDVGFPAMPAVEVVALDAGAPVAQPMTGLAAPPGPPLREALLNLPPPIC